MKNKETAMDSTKKQPFVLGLWGVRYQVKDVQRSISFYTKRWASIWTGKTCPLSHRFQSAISNSSSVVLGRPVLDLRLMAVSKSLADGTGWFF